MAFSSCLIHISTKREFLRVLFTSEGMKDRAQLYWTGTMKRELIQESKLWIYWRIYNPTLTFDRGLWVKTRQDTITEISLMSSDFLKLECGLASRGAKCVSALCRFAGFYTGDFKPGGDATEDPKNTGGIKYIPSGLRTPWDVPAWLSLNFYCFLYDLDHKWKMDHTWKFRFYSSEAFDFLFF